MMHTKLLSSSILIGDSFEVVVASLDDIVSTSEWTPYMVGGDECDAPELRGYGVQLTLAVNPACC